MSKVLVSESSLSSIASSIRAKNGTQTTYTPSQMSTAIDNLPSGGGSYPPDWSQIGYNDTPSNIIEMFNYSKSIYDNWDSSTTSIASMFNGDKKLIIFPKIDTSNVTSMNNAFQNSNLEIMPALNTSEVTSMRYACYSAYNLKEVPIVNLGKINTNSSLSNIFQNCTMLTDESLNNIMASLITATNYPGTKTLATLGLNSTQTAKCQTLSNWTAFTNAGWSA